MLADRSRGVLTMESGNIMVRKVNSARDMLVISLESAKRRVSQAIADITEREIHWEPLSEVERLTDLQLAPDRKKVWRVYRSEGVWIYDYTPETLSTPPFTTIAWIMNHIAQTGYMYLYCVKTGEREGLSRNWEDLPVYPSYEQLRDYIFLVLDDTQGYLEAIPIGEINFELNRLSPAPWGEMRPVYKNVWGGVISHTIEHASQVASLKHRIRFGV